MVFFARIEQVQQWMEVGMKDQGFVSLPKEGSDSWNTCFSEAFGSPFTSPTTFKINTSRKLTAGFYPKWPCLKGDTLKETSFLVSVFTFGGVNLWISVKTFKTAFLASTWIPPNVTIAMKSLLWRCGRPLLPWRRGMPRRRGMSTGTLALLSSKKSG